MAFSTTLDKENLLINQKSDSKDNEITDQLAKNRNIEHNKEFKSIEIKASLPTESNINLDSWSLSKIELRSYEFVQEEELESSEELIEQTFDDIEETKLNTDEIESNLEEKDIDMLSSLFAIVGKIIPPRLN